MNPLNELELIRRILEKVNTPMTSEEVLSFALQGIKDTFDCVACSLILVDSSREYFKVAMSKGWSNDFVKEFHGRPFGGLLRDLATMEAPMVIRKGDPRYQAEGYRFEHDYAAILAVPLSIKGKKVALFYASSAKADGFPPEKVDMLRDLGALCALVLDLGLLGDQVLTLSHLDTLTNLFSYKYWHEELHREVARADSMGTVFSLMDIRLNHMKEYNSALGHAKGDEALVEISRAVKAVLSPLDIPCRLGARWHVLLPGKGEKEAAALAGKVVAAMKSLPPKGDPPLTLSVGVSTYGKGEGEQELLRRAEDALNEARRKGGTGFFVRG